MQSLLDYIAENGPRSDQEWGEFFGISRTHFLGIRSGTAQPSKAVMERMSLLTQGAIPIASWFRQDAA